MRQTGKVIAIPSTDEVDVLIKRETACGHDCTSCGACGIQAKPIVATAKNNLDVKIGDTVTIETNTSHIIGIACIVYVLPVVCLLAFYFISAHFFEQEIISIIIAGLGFALGVLVAILFNRKEAKKGTVCTVVSIEN